jgi:outer membrane receptor protein involved in Fe transport
VLSGEEGQMNKCRFLPALLLLLLVPWSLAAQDNTGRVVGTITDPKGLVVPKAKITVINTLTDVARTAMTDDEGNYQILYLPIGSYKVKAERTGFAIAETKPSELQINQSLRFDIQMKLGTINEIVTVDATAPLIETIESSLGNSVTGEAIIGMPLDGRNTMSLIGLQAGATEQREGGPLGGAAYSISGGRTDAVTYLLDGTVNNNLLDNSLVLNPNPDMIQEFRVITSNGSAEFGRNAGGIVSAVIKSGTDSYHGSVYDYLRNEDFNANRYFNKHGDTISGRPILKRNQFGGTLNGPLVIPGLLDGRKQLFFSFGYQGQRQSSVVNGSAVTVFTPEELNGDFSQAGVNGTPDLGVAGFLRSNPYFQPNPLLADQAIIDPARINSATRSYINAGLIPSSPSGTISPSGKGTDDSDEITAKIDYNPTPADHVAITLGYNRNPLVVPFSPYGYSSNIAGVPYSNKANDSLISATYTKAISSNLINEFRAGAQRNNSLQGVSIRNLPQPIDLGMAITPDLPTGPPLLLFASGLAVGAPIKGPTQLISNTFNISDSLIWSHNHHTIKTGFAMTAFQTNMQYDFIGNGAFDFYGPQGSFSGNDLADFILGLPDDFSQYPMAPTNIRTKSYSAFVQDEWHIRNNLVLTFGLRYEYSTPKSDTKGRTFTISPGKQSSVFPNAPLGLLFPGDAGAPRGANFPDRNDFAPRFGFAWSPDANTSIRGGFGVYYDILKAEDNLQFNGQAPFFSSAYFSFDSLSSNPTGEPLNLTNPYAAVGRTNPFPSKPPSKNMDFSAFLPFGGNGVYFVDPHLRTPYVYQYNLTIQRELATKIVAEISYVGSSSHKLTGQIDINPFVLGTNHRVLNAAGENFSYLSAFANVGSANYNSMQISLEKRSGSSKFLGTSAFKLSYTYGHSLDTSGGFAERNLGQVPSYNPHQLYASSDEDIRHNLTISGRWELPFDRLWDKGSKRFTQGWVLCPIISHRSGFPLDIFAGYPNDPGDPGPSGAGDGSVVRANLVAPIKIYNPKKSGYYWFDKNSVDANVTSGYGTLGRNAFRGPARTNVDISLSKDIAILQDKVNLQLRAEAFNVFNFVQWKDPDENINSSTFGKISDTYAPRIMQFALRLQF